MPSRCLTTTSPVVTRLLISSARSTRLSSRKVRSWLAVALPLSMTARRSSSDPASASLKSERSLAKRPDGALGGDLALEDGVAVADQSRGDVEVVVGGLDERAARVDDRLEVLAGAAEGGAELGDDRLEDSLSTLSTVLVCRSAACRWRSGWRCRPARSRTGRRGTASCRPCGCSSTYCSPTAERLPTSASGRRGCGRSRCRCRGGCRRLRRSAPSWRPGRRGRRGRTPRPRRTHHRSRGSARPRCRCRRRTPGRDGRSGRRRR